MIPVRAEAVRNIKSAAENKPLFSFHQGLAFNAQGSQRKNLQTL